MLPGCSAGTQVGARLMHDNLLMPLQSLQTHRACVASAVTRGNVTFLPFGLVLLKRNKLKNRRGCISREE